MREMRLDKIDKVRLDYVSNLNYYSIANLNHLCAIPSMRERGAQQSHGRRPCCVAVGLAGSAERSRIYGQGLCG